MNVVGQMQVCLATNPTQVDRAANKGGFFLPGHIMHFCFLDESGDSQKIVVPNDNVQPLLVISGLLIDGKKIKALTLEFNALKRKFFPSLFATPMHELDVLITEIKGNDLRKIIRDNAATSATVKHVYKFIDDVLSLLNTYGVRLVARIWIKDFGVPLVDKSIYTITVQQICVRFEGYLQQNQAEGFVIADYRDHGRNQYVSHSIFTQKMRKIKGDAYPSIVEIPTFGTSNNHACLQIADLISTTLLFPMAAQTFCKGHITNGFINSNYDVLKERFRKRLRNLQYNFLDPVSGIRYWGVTVKNSLNTKQSVDLFRA